MYVFITSMIFKHLNMETLLCFKSNIVVIWIWKMSKYNTFFLKDDYLPLPTTLTSRLGSYFFLLEVEKVHFSLLHVS